MLSSGVDGVHLTVVLGAGLKRIARVAGEQGTDTDAVVRHAELVALLRAHLSPATAALFAKPKPFEGGVEWYSDLGGQPQPFTALSGAEASSAQRLLQERLESIRQLADRLEREGGAERTAQAALLRKAARDPEAGTWYSLNGQPVLTVWGPEPPPPVVSQPTAPQSNPAGGLAQTELSPSESSPLPPVVPPAKSRRGCLWLLLALLLLGLLAALLWWLYCPWPRDVVAEFEQKLAAAGEDCAKLQLLQQDPLLQETDPRLEPFRQRLQLLWQQHCLAAPEPEPKPEPAPEIKPEPVPPPPDPCVEERQKHPPELVLVFDASLSMEFSMGLDPKVANDLFNNGGSACFDNASRAQLQAAGYGHICDRLTASPQRMSVAKTAVGSVLKTLPQDVSVGVVLIEDCPAATTVGFYKPEQRNSLLKQMQVIHAVGGTPLADGVARAGAMLDGVNRDAHMLVISDGEESCNGDPCAVAAQLAAAKPRLKINVLDIMNVGAGNCLASATGGKVFPATQVDQVTVRLQEAVQDLMGSSCANPSTVAPTQ